MTKLIFYVLDALLQQVQDILEILGDFTRMSLRAVSGVLTPKKSPAAKEAYVQDFVLRLWK